MVSIVRSRQPETQQVTGARFIECADDAQVQREIPILAGMPAPMWVDEAVVAQWTCHRDAVAWCWENQRFYRGVRENARQAMFANAAGLHAPHASRCLRANSAAPMELPDRCTNAFESFTGWRGLRQWQLRDAGLTAMEHVIAQRRVA